MLNLQTRTSLLVEVARLYYEHGYSQQKIADKLGLSRPTVSRILHQAREEGIIRIQITDPSDRGTVLEDQIRRKFHLKKVIVVPNDGVPDGVLKQRLGRAAADYLDRLIQENTILGISWGTTMQEVANHVRPRPVRGVKVVQLNGGVSRAEYDTRASEVAQKIAEKYQAVPFLLPLPAIVDRAELKDAILQDRNISRTLNLAREASIAMFTVGAFDYDSVLVKADYFDPAEVESLLKNRAVGDICSRIITEDGDICSPDLDARTIGIDLQELHKKPFAIAVAGGAKKARAVYAGILGKHFNVLITDERVAMKLLEFSNNRGTK
ncbi:MAG: sugar-binding transcriptional regulator [Calditrichaeota bacterium]|nr:sugar-binding transcriptional regulator [Calditrichota bacterium]